MRTAVCLSLLLLAHLPAVAGEKVYVECDGSRSHPSEHLVLAKPGLDARIAARLHCGEAVEIIGEAGEWRHVRTGHGAEGWVLPDEGLYPRHYAEFAMVAAFVLALIWSWWSVFKTAERMASDALPVLWMISRLRRARETQQPLGG